MRFQVVGYQKKNILDPGLSGVNGTATYENQTNNKENSGEIHAVTLAASPSPDNHGLTATSTIPPL